MRSILVLNPKGGSGKTTIAINLAVFYALRGKAVTLVDFDHQGSSMDWLAARPDERPPIHGVDAADGRVHIPRNTDVVIMDAPAALHGRPLSDLVRRVETLVVPVVPSPIDMRAAHRFHGELLRLSKVHNQSIKVATVANRVRENSPSRWLLEDYLRSLALPDGKRLPFVTCLRNSQNYIRAAERGLGVAEIAPSLTYHDMELWAPLLRWLNSKRSLPETA